MDIQRFAQLIDTYGGQSEQWPSEVRDVALAFLAHSAEAQKLQQTASQLDSLLNFVTVNEPSPFLKQRILRHIFSPKLTIWQELKVWLLGATWPQYLWRPALTLLLPLILGIILGSQLTFSESTNVQEALWQEEISLLASMSIGE